jgi:hypothetical protein
VLVAAAAAFTLLRKISRIIKYRELFWGVPGVLGVKESLQGSEE